MIRHIIALLATALAVAAILYMANLDRKVHKWELIQEIIKKSQMEVPIAQKRVQKQMAQREEKSEEEKQLQALKRKAGTLAAFQVSKLYRRNCASCHGVNGEGGVGPKLIGKSAEYILSQLHAFKTGKRKNYVMFGLLNNLKEEDLQKLAQEIGTFAQKMKEANK